jgi:cellulose synthase/poly-beta-1,6-N-acetylglucosamine synthase-like glycosyltransferase
MESETSKHSRIFYVAFALPFLLTYISWQFFPVFAQQTVSYLFGYSPLRLEPNLLWFALIRFFYTWYTFLAIGVAGVWAIAAAFARIERSQAKQLQYPAVSFVVPAFNEEKNISRCISSIYACTEKYPGHCEIIVVDDGSDDFTYEIAWSTIALNREKYPAMRAKVVRHTANMGKIQAIRTGVDKALGSHVAIVDADSWWNKDTLVKLVNSMLLNGKKAVTGYVHPSDGDTELNSYVVLQQLEYSQGLGTNRCAQSLGNNVLVVSGALSLYDAQVLRSILIDTSVRSVAEDLEITLEMHRRGAGVGYVSDAAGSTVAPESFRALWNQRLRWFTGWFHNTLNIHKSLLLKKSWLSVLFWYSYVFEYAGAFVDLAALIAFPFLFWFAPDRVFFVANLLIFIPYGLLIGVINQSIALKYAYNSHNYRDLLFYTPFYPILRLINVLARLTSIFRYSLGDHGRWNHSTQ